MKSYKDLEIYKSSFLLSIEMHKMSLKLPKYEIYEQGSQIRRSSKSITSNIVEGYGRRKYKNDFIKFLIYSQASCDETINHLLCISKIHFKDKTDNKELIAKYEILGKQLYKFISYVEGNWK